MTRPGSLLRRAGRGIYRWLFARLDDPVLVYTMGKVASSSVYRGLKAVPGVNAYDVHRMSPEGMAWAREEHRKRGVPPSDPGLGAFLFRRLMRPRRPARLVTLVREPVGRNISAFFQNLEAFRGNRHGREAEQLIEEFFRTYPHEIPLTWFDREMKASTGIDVYEHEFPKERGRQVIRREPYELLLLRHDLPDPEKEASIAAFLGLEAFRLTRSNVGAEKDYADRYRRFLDAVRVPVEYADRLLRSKYARHFYPEEELDSLHRRWTAGD